MDPDPTNRKQLDQYRTNWIFFHPEPIENYFLSISQYKRKKNKPDPTNLKHSDTDSTN